MDGHEAQGVLLLLRLEPEAPVLGVADLQPDDYVEPCSRKRADVDEVEHVGLRRSHQQGGEFPVGERTLLLFPLRLLALELDPAKTFWRAAGTRPPRYCQ